jgi:hypothetical protein
MSKQPMTGVPVCTWVAVTDASGRTHMEARPGGGRWLVGISEGRRKRSPDRE